MSNPAQQPTLSVVLAQSNEPDQNRLLAFRRDMAGALTPMDAVSTGGRGNGEPHLPSQGSVRLSRDRRHAFVANTGSGDVSVFTLDGDGPALAHTVRTGEEPLSVAEHDGLVYVLNSADASLAGFAMDGSRPSPLAAPIRRWDPEGKPAQVGFSPDGRTLVVTERGSNTILTFPVDPSGSLGEPQSQPASGLTPYGFGFTPAGVLIVTEASGGEPGRSAMSSYAVKDSSLTTVTTRSVGNGRTALCWGIVTHDGRYAFGTNFGDGAVSRYDIAPDGSLTLGDGTAALVTDGAPGPRDLDVSGDGRFLYAVDADARRLVGWFIDPAGRLTPVGSWPGLPVTVAGIAVS